MSFLDDLRKRLKERWQTKKTTSLSFILRKATGCRDIFVSDRHLDLLRKEDVMTFLWIDKTDKKEYAGEEWDCDDFARELLCRAKNHFSEKRGLNAAFGLVGTSYHTFNFFVDKDRKLWFIEPQTDAFISSITKPRFMVI